MNRHNRFYLPYSAFPNNYNPCSPDDFISDEMSGYQSINYLEFDEFRNGSECKDSRSTRRERLSHYGGKWSDRGEPNGGYYNHPEDRGYPSNHCNNKCPDQHSKGGRKGSLKKPDSQESTSKQEQVILIESDDSGSVEVVQETSPPEKVPDATLSDIQSRKKEKRKLRKQRQRENRAALKAQARPENQLKLTTVTSKDVDGATAEKQLEPELEKRKRKERQSADHEPKLKIVKTSGASKDSTDKTTTEKAVTLKNESNPETTGQSNARPSEKTNKDSTSAPVGLNTVEQNSCGARSSAQTSKSTANGRSCKQKLEAKTNQESKKQGKKQIHGRRFSAHRLTFVCRVCKFSSFYKWKLKAHLKSKFHKDHFKFLSEHLSKPTVDFLKTHFSKMQQKVQDFIDQIPNHRATLCQVYEDQDLTLDISMEHFIKKAEVAHCLACDEYIPMQYYLIELHLRSPDHRANCKGMMVQSKNLGLTTVQRLLRLKCTQQKLKCYVKDIGVTIEPKRNHREVWSTQQRAVPEATQEAELPCEQVMQAAEAVEKWKDQEAGLFSAQVIQADEREKDGIDLKAKLICGQAIQATAAVEDGKTQLQETVCVREIQADGAGEVKNVVEPSIEQVIQGNDAVEDGKKQKVEPFCGLMMEADEVVGDGKDQEVEPICAQVIQANKIVGKTKDREVDEAVDYRKDQETEPLSKKMVLAPDPVINGERQACEESIPATENLQEPEQWQRTQPLFDLLDEEDDLEGVELGEEEMGEDI